MSVWVWSEMYSMAMFRNVRIMAHTVTPKRNLKCQRSQVSRQRETEPAWDNVREPFKPDLLKKTHQYSEKDSCQCEYCQNFFHWQYFWTFTSWLTPKRNLNQCEILPERSGLTPKRNPTSTVWDKIIYFLQHMQCAVEQDTNIHFLQKSLWKTGNKLEGLSSPRLRNTCFMVTLSLQGILKYYCSVSGIEYKIICKDKVII